MAALSSADVWKWVLTLAGAVVMTVGGGVVSTLWTQNARIATVETRQVDGASRLERVERKLDKILERLPAPRMKGGDGE